METETEYRQKLEQYAAENPKPVKYEWDSPEFYSWFKERNAPPALNESAIGNRKFFAKPHMAEFRKYLTSILRSVWNPNTNTFYYIDPASVLSSPKYGNRYIQIGSDGPKEDWDDYVIETTYYLDSDTGKIWKIDGNVFQDYVDGQDFSITNYAQEYDAMVDDILTELLRQKNIVAQSFQEFVLQNILITQTEKWSQDKYKDPLTIGASFNILRIMAGLGGLAYSS